MTLDRSDTAKVMAVVASTRKMEADEFDVAVWHDLFTDANINHPTILYQATRTLCQKEDSRYGITPGQIIAAYKKITRGIAERVTGWGELSYDQRQAILADPVELAYEQGKIGAVEYQQTRQRAELAAGDAETFRRAAIERGFDIDAVGRGGVQNSN